MARIDVVKAKIDLLKTVMVTFVFGLMAALAIYNLQTSGANFIVVIVAIVIIGIFALMLSKTLKALFDELEKL